MSTPNPTGTAVQRGGAYLPGSNPGAPWMDTTKYSFRTFFVYELDTLAALGPAGNANLSFNIAGDSDFFLTKLCGNVISDDGSSGFVPGDVSISITNTTSGRQYMSGPVPLISTFGTGTFPFIIPMVTLWNAKSTIQCQLANVAGNTYNLVNLSFIGIKAFFS